MLHLAELWSRVLIFTDFERWIFKIGIIRGSNIFTPIDSSHRELQIRFLSVKNGFELIVLRSDEVDVVFSSVIFSFLRNVTLYIVTHITRTSTVRPSGVPALARGCVCGCASRAGNLWPTRNTVRCDTRYLQVSKRDCFKEEKVTPITKGGRGSDDRICITFRIGDFFGSVYFDGF